MTFKNLFDEAKKLEPDNIFSKEEMLEKLGGITLQSLYIYMKKADVKARKLADGTPYFTQEEFKKILFRGKGVDADGTTL